MEIFEKQDKEVMDLVNKANHTESDVAAKDRTVSKKANTQTRKCDNSRFEGCRRRTMKIKAFVFMILKVLLCAAASLLFSLILVRPEWVEPVAHLGIVIAGAVAAVHVDRFITRY